MTLYRACVASPHHLASDAGARVLDGGGNALDAAIAANLVLAVVTPYMCGVGGDLFALVHRGGVLHGYNGSGRAPRAATPEAVRAAAGAGTMPVRGALPVTVPGAVEGWFALLDAHGTRAFDALAEPALAYARDGFEPGDAGARALARRPDGFSDEWAAVYAGARPDEPFRQPELARTLDAVARRGPEAFYRGEVAEAVVAYVRAHGGLLSVEDLASHRGDRVDPLSARTFGVEVFELPPNTQGVAALEALAIADGLPADTHHRIEAAKLAMSDLAMNVTDPDAMRIDPRALLAPEWIAERRARIDPARAGAPPPGPSPGGGTVAVIAADADGMLVSLIQSNCLGYGSGLTVPGWGINLHNRGCFFSLDPSHPNVVAPGKRTLHTLIPAVAMRDGAPWLAFGTMGLTGQAQTHVQLLARLATEGVSVDDAIGAPRWVVSMRDWSVLVEERMPGDVVDDLRARGHAVTLTRAYDAAMGHAHAVRFEPGGGVTAAADPRSEGAVRGVPLTR